MTASDTVVRVTPASVAAAPTYGISSVQNVSGGLTMAYSPGTIQSVSWQTLKIDMFGCVNSIHSIANPTIRPKHAPTAKEGMKIPAYHQLYSTKLTYLAT
jgi:hypothetical protein